MGFARWAEFRLLHLVDLALFTSAPPQPLSRITGRGQEDVGAEPNL